ncbi:MAG: GNAT family N-acetyltransferase [Phycisphaerales bacterium]
MIQGAPIIRTERAVLRPLVEADVGQAYLDWFSDPEVVRFIEAARVPQSIESLRSFVRLRSGRSDVWFFGIFVGRAERLVGTIKCEPIDAQARLAVMGILIGAADWRGVGLAGELMPAVALTLHDRLGVRHIDLGVDRENLRACRAYERIGFRASGETSSGVRMRLDISTLLGTEGGFNAAT